jgi:predicted NBD/HSP70 family sugar kinase
MVTPPLAAVLAQWSNDPVPAAQGIATVLIEERVRAGLFFHGRPFAGVHERAGRIGEMLTGNDRRPLDDVASAAAFRKLSLGQSARRHWVDEAATHLLDAIFALVGFLRPARVTVGGDLPAEVALALIERMLDLSAAREPEATAPSLPPITYARYGKDAVLVGAALLPFFGTLLPDPR